MKLIRTQDAVGHVLCHDMTQIIPGQYKDARFRKGHVVREEDIPVLLSMGKENLYVWEMVPGMVHENDAAQRLCAEDVPYRVLCTDQLHSAASLMISTGSPARTVPSFRTATKMPSVGMTQVPAAFLMAQSLWHSLPI